MANTGTILVLTAGGVTFVNQWYQTRNVDWKVPVATVILAAGVDALANLDNRGATILGFMILLGAATTRFNGKSAIDTVTHLTKSQSTAPLTGSQSKVPNR